MPIHLCMKRRDFIAALGGAAALPLAARAQQTERVRRIGVLMNLAADDAEGQARLAAFLQGLQEAGWAVGRNVRIDLRWGAGDADRFRKQAAELVALAPDVVLASSLPVCAVAAGDPHRADSVRAGRRPGWRRLGREPSAARRQRHRFHDHRIRHAGKWVELLKEIAPGVTRVAVLRDAASTSGIGQLGAIQSVAPSFGMELTPVGVSDAGEIERAVTAFARASNGGLIVTPVTLAIVHRDLIITLAARHQLPAVYGLRPFVTSGGLICYGA